MDDKECLRVAFADLSARLAATDASDKDGLVRVGTQIESLLTAVPTPDGATQQLLTQVLGILQAVYGGQHPDGAAGMREAAAIIAALACPSPAPAAQPATRAPAPQLSIDAVAARLVAVTPDDRDEIALLRDAVMQWQGSPLPPVRCPAQSVVAALEASLAAGAPDAAARLQEAGVALDLLSRALEDSQQPAPPAAQADAAVLAASAAQETPATPSCPVVLDDPAAPAAPQASAAETVPAPAAPPTLSPAAQPLAPAKAPPAAVASLVSVLPEDTDMDLLKEYIVESLDHVVLAETSLLALETNPTNAEPINTVFRAFHTIKGSSGFLGLTNIQRLAHLSENLLERARSGSIRVTGGYADLALKSCDMLKGMIEMLQSARPGQDLPVAPALGELLVKLSDPEAAGIGEDEAAAPMRVGDILVGEGEVSREAVEEAVKSQGQKPLGQVLIESGAASAAAVGQAIRVQHAMNPAGSDATIRVGTDRLDSLINMVGELVISQSMVAHDPDVLCGAKPRLTRSVVHTGKIVRQLQDLTMSLRMVPLKGTFGKMARLVRDVAKKAGKSVQFITEGEETEIDRNMVEVINDPLIHMIRNAVDHGIELADTRRQKGKNPIGTVTLRAYHSAGAVVIELVDDGKGLDREKIRAKAVEKGLVAAGTDLSESDVFGLIFAPGFSTADKITDVSGRGVGMDVVKKGIEKLRGRIDIASAPGAGSTFTVRLPLTMAITDAMMLRVGRQRYLLPTISIEHSFRPVPGSISTVAGRGEMLVLRGQLLPLFRLYQLFGVADAVTDPCQGLVVVVEGGGKRCAVMVDELLGQQQVVIKSLGRTFANVPGVSGGAILVDGRVGLILDGVGLINLAHGQARDSREAA